MKYLIIALCFLAGFFKAVRDTLMFHFSSSIFKNWNEQFFNPAISWMNKYKDYPADKKEAFFLSKTVLVSLTDAWHLSELLMLACLLAILFIKNEKLINRIIAVVAFFVSFNLFYYLMG